MVGSRAISPAVLEAVSSYTASSTPLGSTTEHAESAETDPRQCFLWFSRGKNKNNKGGGIGALRSRRALRLIAAGCGSAQALAAGSPMAIGRSDRIAVAMPTLRIFAIVPQEDQ